MGFTPPPPPPTRLYLSHEPLNSSEWIWCALNLIHTLGLHCVFINKLWTKIPWKHQTTPLSLHTGKLKDQIKTVHDNIHDRSRKELLSKLSEKVKWKLNANKQEMGTTKINDTVLMHPKIIIIISRNIPKRYWQSIRKINMSISGKKH